MADQSAIEWTDATWNPVTGCDRVSPGCTHCYALDLASRLKRMGNARYQNDGDPKSSGPGFGVMLHPDVLEKPLKWRKPRRVFVNSMSDLFHEAVSRAYIDDVFAVMAMAPQHTFQVLTKRPERMRDYFTDGKPWERIANRCYKINRYGSRGLQVATRQAWPLPNVWLGVSIENRRFVHRADLLRQTPAAVRFISAEPLLGPLVPGMDGFQPNLGDYGQEHALGEWAWPDGKLVDEDNPALDLTAIDWLIVGGESGSEHRPMKYGWVHDLREVAIDSQCRRCSVDGGVPCGHVDCERHTAFFFKQWGGRTPKAGGRFLDGRTWDEFPTPVAESRAA